MKQIERNKSLSSGLRILLVLLLLIITSTVLYAETIHGGTGRGVRNGVGLGTIIAVVLSWSRNQSVFWAIVHGILNWLYVIYFVLSRGDRN